MSFDDWQELIRDVVHCHSRVICPGGFVAVNIGDIICFTDESMPRYQADNICRKKVAVTREQILETKKKHPSANRYELARLLGCSEQTVQRRLEGNNVRGGKHAHSTKIKLTGCLLERWAEGSWPVPLRPEDLAQGPVLGKQPVALQFVQSSGRVRARVCVLETWCPTCMIVVAYRL